MTSSAIFFYSFDAGPKILSLMISSKYLLCTYEYCATITRLLNFNSTQQGSRGHVGNCCLGSRFYAQLLKKDTVLHTLINDRVELTQRISKTITYDKGPSMYYVSTFLDFFWPTHPTFYVSINTVLNISKNIYFLNPPSQADVIY